MAILQECPVCKRKQSLKNNKCKCGADIAKARRSRRVRYWNDFVLPNGKRRREYVGYSLDDARAVAGKRKVQKVETPHILERFLESTDTFQGISDWYLSLSKVKALSSYWRKEIALNNFNNIFGEVKISDISLTDIEDYQQTRQNQGIAPSTIDREVGEVKTMIYKAHDDGRINDRVVLIFKKVKKTMRRNANARDNVISHNDFERLMECSPPHLQAILAMGYYTGMRKSEILNLTWNKVDMKRRVIRLAATDTKDREPRTIPICDELFKILKRQPRALNSPRVFLYRDRPVTDNFKRSLARACEKSGMPYGRKVPGGFVFHDLRHTFTTVMRRAGIPESVIMKITGHSTREMFDRYSTVDDEDTRQAVGRMEDYLGNAKLQNVDLNVDLNE